MIRSITSSPFAAIMSLPPSTELPGPKNSRSGPKSAVWVGNKFLLSMACDANSVTPMEQVDGALAIDTEVSLPEVAEIDDSDLVNFATACARIERLQRRVEQTLDRLEHQGGPAPLESIQWLVWELCECL